jgi:small-conductance mechanosensitive channel
MIKREYSPVKPSNFSWIMILFWVSAVVIAVLWSFGMLEPVKEFLGSDEMSVHIGEKTISAFIIVKAFLILIFLLWLSRRISIVVEKRLRKSMHISSSNRALTIKILNIILYLISPLIVLYAMGIDITTITVFGGAVGIGLGFGLQKIASNFISGIILLFEKTIDEGDLIEFSGGGAFGFVKEISARHTRLETLDSKEILVPNEDFITNRVINWTLSNKLGRVTVDVCITFDSDPVKAKKIMYDIINNNPIRSHRKVPECHLLKLGTYGYEFKLFMWVDDIAEYFFIATDDIIFKLLKRFKEEGIKIAYPIQDVYLKDKQ